VLLTALPAATFSLRAVAWCYSGCVQGGRGRGTQWPVYVRRSWADNGATLMGLILERH